MAGCYKPEVYKKATAFKVATDREERQKLYDHRWADASRLFRDINPFCVICGDLATGNYGATDHIQPHNNNLELFWDQSNWQTLCIKCHGRKSARERWQMSDAALPVQQLRRFVVTGPPNSGKTTYVNQRKREGALVWDADDIAFVMCGAKRHEWPVYMRAVIASMLDGLIKALQVNVCSEVWIIVTDVERAAEVARSIGAEVVLIGGGR